MGRVPLGPLQTLHVPNLPWILRHKVLFRDAYEPEVKKALKTITGRLFVDIGANKGHYSIMLADNFDRVYAIEPDPKILPVLKNRVARSRYRNISVLDIAFADRNGEAAFYQNPLSKDTGSANTLLPEFEYRPGGRERHPPDTRFIGKDSVLVPVQAYDSFIGQDYADLVKIDVEGAEFLVLEGMRSSLRNRMVKHIMVELHDRDRLEALTYLLTGYGYTIQMLDQHPRVLASLKEQAA